MVNKSLCHLNLLLISIKVVFCFLTKIHQGRHPVQVGHNEAVVRPSPRIVIYGRAMSLGGGAARDRETILASDASYFKRHT